MELSTIIGSSAGIFTTLAALPQLIKSWKTKSTKDVSLEWCSILLVGVLLWLIYGVMVTDWPLIIANILTFIFVSGILFLKLRYG